MHNTISKSYTDGDYMVSGDIVEYIGVKPHMKGKKYVVQGFALDTTEDDTGQIFDETHMIVFQYFDDEDARLGLDELRDEGVTPVSRIPLVWKKIGHVGS